MSTIVDTEGVEVVEIRNDDGRFGDLMRTRKMLPRLNEVQKESAQCLGKDCRIRHTEAIRRHDNGNSLTHKVSADG